MEKLGGATVSVLVMRETLIPLADDDGFEPDLEAGADVTVAPGAVPTDDPGLTCEPVEIEYDAKRLPDSDAVVACAGGLPSRSVFPSTLTNPPVSSDTRLLASE